MDMHDPHRTARRGIQPPFHDERSRDLVLSEKQQCILRRHVYWNGLGRAGHDFGGPGCEKLAEVTAEISVGNDAQQSAGHIRNACYAETTRCHGENGVRHAGSVIDQRHSVAAMHDVAHRGQAKANGTAGMERPEAVAADVARVHDGHGERVAQRQLQGRGGRGRDVGRAGFPCCRKHQANIGMIHDERLPARCNADDRDFQGARVQKDSAQFRRVAGVRDDDQRITLHQHAEVAMRGFGRVDEHRRRAGGGQCRGDLARNMARLSHAGYDHTLGRMQDRFTGRDEIIAEGLAQATKCFRFNSHNFAAPRDDRVPICPALPYYFGRQILSPEGDGCCLLCRAAKIVALTICRG